MNALNFLANPVADALGWTLLHAIWQGFALVFPAALILHLLRNQSSSLRYRVSVLTLLAQLLLSAATFIWYYKPMATTLPAATFVSTGQPMPMRWQTIAQTIPWHQQMQQFLEIHLNQFVLIYLIGVVLFGLRLAGGWLYLQRLSHRATQPTTVVWAHLTDKLRAAMAIRAVVQVRESARIAVPMVVGVLTPVLLLPIGLATQLTTREIEAVLAHELAHIKRYDYGVNLLQSVVEVLYFFHPALWWLSARVREEREHCCDDLAVQVCGGDGRILAQALARVEELRLIQTNQAPVLAMAFASKRRQLLHRVRRMLGVPTRPFVSNSSLAGLTLATILLMSISVYAVQDEKPKPRATQPQPTRRHKVDSNSEYGMAGNKKISYVIWKGQKLPTNRVARLQRQLNQVMAGQLSLDNVPKDDRDVLLTIVEKNNSFDSGMNSLAEGLSHIDYNNIVTSALKNVPLSPDGTVEGLAKVNYDSVVQNAMASISKLQLSSDSLKRITAQRKLDSLMASMNAVMAQRKEAIERITKEMSAVALKNQDFEKQLSPLRNLQSKQAGKLGELAGKQARLGVELARLSQRHDAKARAMQKQMEAEQGRLQRQMEQYERQIEQSMKQFEPLTNRLEPVQERLSVLADSISQLYEPISAMSAQIGELSEQLSEDAVRQAQDAMRIVENIHLNIDKKIKIDTPISPVRPRPAPRAPRLSKGVKPVHPAVPPVPAVPVRPNVKVEPVQPPIPHPAPKPKPAPNPDKHK